MPLSPLMWIMAALPIIVLLVLMVGFNWGGTKAAPVGLAIAVFTAFVFYKADLFLVTQETLKGFWSALVVLIVVWPAILLYEVVREAKGFIVFRRGLQKATPNELIQIMALGWVFMSFLQGITGFGVPVAVGAPLLVGMGVSPIFAVLIPLIGHSWANTFGTLAVAWDALVLQTGLLSDPKLLLQTAFMAALFIWIWNFMIGISLAWIYGKKEALKKGLPAIALISLIQGGGQLLMSQINTTLAAFIPAVVSLIAVFLLSKTKRYGTSWRIEKSKIMNRESVEGSEDEAPTDMSVHQSFLPYYVLTFITLFVLLIAPIKNFLGQFKIGFSFPETVTGYGYVNASIVSYSPLSIFTHAGLFLLLSSIIGYLFYVSHGWIKKGKATEILRRSLEKTGPSAIAVLGFILMSRIMGGTGQTVVLAQGIAAALGIYYAILAPAIGMLGSFMTSSNMASNILFGEFQLTTASILKLNVAAILGAQTAGGAIGGTLAPGNIILGTTTAAILGQEGLVLKKVLPIALATTLIIGAILFVLVVL